MAQIFLAELETLIAAGNKGVVEERPSCKESKEDHIRNDVVCRDHCIYPCISGVELILCGNCAGIGDKTGLAEEVSAKGEVSNKTNVNGLVDEFMQLRAIIGRSLKDLKYEYPICKVEQHQGNSADEVENGDD